MGLETSEHIGKILIDPRNSNVVYVAAQGPLFSAGGERGLYKTTDGGATWTAVLTISDDTGISDIVFDPKNPDVIYASATSAGAHVGQMIGGGPEGGIFKSTERRQDVDEADEGSAEGRHRAASALGVDPQESGDACSRSIEREAAGAAAVGDGGGAWTRIGRMTPPAAAASVDGAGLLSLATTPARRGRGVGRTAPAAGRGGRGAPRRRRGDDATADDGEQDEAGARPQPAPRRRQRPTTGIAAAARRTTTRSSSIRTGPTRSGR